MIAIILSVYTTEKIIKISSYKIPLILKFIANNSQDIITKD
jgi:hypothetical protein